MEIITLREDYIKLGQALKAAALVEDGVEAKLVIKEGCVTVNGEVDTRRGRKLYDGDVVCYNGNVSTTTRRSKRPGRSRAGSRTSGRLVAPR